MHSRPAAKANRDSWDAVRPKGRSASSYTFVITLVASRRRVEMQELTASAASVFDLSFIVSVILRRSLYVYTGSLSQSRCLRSFFNQEFYGLGGRRSQATRDFNHDGAVRRHW